MWLGKMWLGKLWLGKMQLKYDLEFRGKKNKIKKISQKLKMLQNFAFFVQMECKIFGKKDFWEKKISGKCKILRKDSPFSLETLVNTYHKLPVF